MLADADYETRARTTTHREDKSRAKMGKRLAEY